MKLDRSGQATVISRKEFDKVFNGFKTPNHRLFWAIAWYTGERPGTILKSKVDQFYQFYESSTTRLVPRESIIFPKNARKDKKTREVHTHRTLLDILSWYETTAGVDGSVLLFPSNNDRNLPVSLRAIDSALRLCLERVNLANRGITLYSPRRSFITSLARQGLNPRLLQQLSGHSSLNSLQKYIDVDPEQLKRAINSLE